MLKYDVEEACCGTVLKGAVIQGHGVGSAIIGFGVQGGAVVKGDGGGGAIVRVGTQGGCTIVEGGVVSVVKAVVGAEVEGEAIELAKGDSLEIKLLLRCTNHLVIIYPFFTIFVSFENGEIKCIK